MFRRDRPAFFFTFAFPIMFMVLFGLIFGGGGTSRPTVDVVGSGPLRQALENSDAHQAQAAARRGTALKRVRDGDEPAADPATAAMPASSTPRPRRSRRRS